MICGWHVLALGESNFPWLFQCLWPYSGHNASNVLQDRERLPAVSYVPIENNQTAVV